MQYSEIFKGEASSWTYAVVRG